MFLAMFQVTLNWTEQVGPSGVYVVQLLCAILGLAIALSDNEQLFLYKKLNHLFFISLLGLSHALALFSRMEWAVRPGNELNDTYFKLSLNGGWWWDTSIGPNVVFVIGALVFPSWLITTWMIVRNENHIAV